MIRIPKWRRLIKTDFAVATTKGKIRKKNQDNYFIDGKTRGLEEHEHIEKGIIKSEYQLYAVFDGIGGERSGEIASKLAADLMKEYAGERFFHQYSEYVRESNMEICRYQRDHGIVTGTTVAALALKKDSFLALNLGDSRIYRIRMDHIEQLSMDHTEFQIMADAGLLDPQRHKGHKAVHSLTQYLGVPEDDFTLEPCVTTGETRKGDKFLLCSDGLQEGLSNKQILSIILSEPNPEQASKKLLKEAEDCGSKDNITAVLIQL